jgi:glycosyltransferase involved in cell wall biosynthesis
VTISDFSQRELLRVTGRTARTVAAHPRRPVDQAPPAGDGSIVLVVGALRRYKGIETVIDALALLPVAIRPRVICAGPTEHRRGHLIRRALTRGVRDNVELAGWVDDRALEPLWGQASACLCPSTYEGYGLPVAESLARGIATVASDIPAHREIGGDAVSFFEAGDARSLAEALETVLGDAELRASLGRRGLARAHELAQATPGWRELILEAARSDGDGQNAPRPLKIA